MGTPEQLVSAVGLGAWDDVLDHWKDGDGCPAWIDSADRRCRKAPATGYLCTRHHNVAVKRWAAHVEKEQARRDRSAERRAAALPGWREELEKVEAEMNRLDPPRPDNYDRAAYGGNVHPSIQRKRAAFMSDSRVQRMAALSRRHEELVQNLGADR